MKFIKPVPHAFLDYATVLTFAAAPSLLGLQKMPALIAYALAGAHLLTTLMTDYKPALFRLLPFPVHGWMERIIGPALIFLPFVLGFSDDRPALFFYVGFGIAIFVVSWTTDYRAAS